MKNKKPVYLINWLSILLFSLLSAACSQEDLDAELEIADGAGTLTTYKAYTIDSLAGSGMSVYGRAVFWKGLDGTTLLQISLYNVTEGADFPAGIFSGALPGTSEIIALYDIANTGEGYGFGEFSVSKYFTIEDESFFDDLDSYNANIQIMLSDTNQTVIAAGNIGINADPVESSD